MAPEIDAATRITAQAFYRKGQGTTGIAALDLQIERVRAKAADAMSVALASDFQGIKRLEEGSEERREAIEALYGTIVSAQEDDKDVIFHKDAQYLSKATRAMFENLKTLTGADRQRALKE